MGVEIIAISPDDGRAFVVADGKIFLVRPPYTSSSIIEVSQKVVANAIHSYGFAECNLPFDGISEAVKFIKAKYIELKQQQDIELPSLEGLKDLLEPASDDILLNYVKTTESELISKEKHDAAESIAIELLNLENIKNNPELNEKVIAIIEKCHQIRMQKKAAFFAILAEQTREIINSNYPTLMERYSPDDIIRLQEDVLERGQLLPLI